MNLRSLLSAAAAVLCFGVLADSANAAPITFSDRSTWEALVPGASNVDFEGIVPGSTYVYQGTSTTIGGVTFNGPDGMYVIDELYAEGGGPFGMGTGDVLFSYTSGIEAVLPYPVSAVGVDVRGYLEASTVINVFLSTGASFTTTVTNPGGGFFGVISDVLITAITFDPTTSYIAIDNFSYGAAGAVPAPGALALLGLGLLGLGVARRRKPA